MAEGCPGADGLVCIDGWLYSGLGGMIFPANKRCPTCNPPERVASLETPMREKMLEIADKLQDRAKAYEEPWKNEDGEMNRIAFMESQSYPISTTLTEVAMQIREVLK